MAKSGSVAMLSAHFAAVKIVRRAEFDDDRPYEREFSGIRKFEPISRTHEGFVDLLQVGRNDTEGWFYYVMELADPIPVGDDVRRLTSTLVFPQLSTHTGLLPRTRTVRLTSTPVSPQLSTPHSPLSTSYTPRTLSSEVKLRGAIPLDECLKIAISLARALAELHRNDLVHRDIKPSNIIFVGGVPKLADIGLVASATDARSFVGTEGFIPPEGPGTPQADLYSLGILLYVIATGKTHRDFPEPPADLATRPDRAQYLELSAIIHRACQANPRTRYPTAAAMLADLERLQAGQSIKRRHTLQRSFSWAWKAAVFACVVIIILVIVRNERERRSILNQQNLAPWQQAGTTNIAAWEALERAGQMASTYTAVGTSNAILETDRAIALDPKFTGAWATLASYLNTAASLGFMPSKPAMERARLCAETAVSLNPTNAGAHFLIGECVVALTYDFTKAEAIMRRAIALKPKFTALQNNISLYLTYYGRFDEAQAILKQVHRDDPKWGGAHSLLAKIHAAKRQFEPALLEIEQALQLLPDRPSFHLLRSEILWAMERKDEAARAFLRFVEMNGYVALDRAIDLPALAQTLNTGGPETFLIELIKRLEQAHESGRFVSQYDLATLHARAGNKPRALDWLEQAVDEHRTLTLGAKYSPVFKDFQDEPRYHAVLQKLRLEP